MRDARALTIEQKRLIEMTLLNRVMATRIGGSVERCHCVLHQGSYSVAAHTWGVLSLLYILWPDDFSRLAKHIMFHDVPEAWVGDIPAPVKRYNSAVKVAVEIMERKIFKHFDLPSDFDLDELDTQKIRNCDSLELYLWAREQIFAGNWHAHCVVRELDRFFEETPLLDPAGELYRSIRDRHVAVEHATDGLIAELHK